MWEAMSISRVKTFVIHYYNMSVSKMLVLLHCLMMTVS